jgi:hypothetical protein
MPPPAGLATDEILVIGHSNVATFIAWYRTLSSRDLLPAIVQGGITVKVWGDPLNGSHESAWASLAVDEPVGGYRAAWLMLGFQASFTETEAEMQAWIDTIITRLHADFPGLEYVWYSPMNTYFATNPGDGDSADLVAFDPWGTNPSGLTAWTDDAESEMAWNMTLYAQSQAYFDDFGPWINLTDAQTDVDERHPTEGANSGQSHGGEILLAFFDGSLDQPPVDPPPNASETETNRMGGVGAVRRAGRR